MMKAGGNGKISIGAWIAIVMASVVGAIGSQADGQGPDPVMSGSVQVERLGSPAGRDLVLIPGLATPGEVWTDTVATLRDSVDAHVVTLAGFGDVPAVPRGEAGVVGSAVADLAAWLEAENIEDAVLVGHSMGAQIALQVAAQTPDHVGAVVVVDSAPFFARLFNPAITEAQASAYAAGMSAQMAAAPREQFLAMSRQGLPVQSITADGQARVMGWMEMADQAVVSAAMGEVMGSDYSAVLPQVSVPVTVMFAWSEGSPMSAEQLESVYAGQYAGLAQVELMRVDDSRHFIMLDQPDLFRSALGVVIARPEGEN